MAKAAKRKFIETVNAFYRDHGRHDLPWRHTIDPYRVTVSEIMLQQTQVDRVIPKYHAFLKQFPTAKRLAHAPLAEVLTAWQGLGYNRRAKMLHNYAKEIVTEHRGKFPTSYQGLKQLPGIGPYTAGAIAAFAFNVPHPMIETNIRTVYLHHFFNDETEVSDTDIFRYIESTLDTENPREWYWALMDYGAHLKKEHGNPNYKSKTYKKQSAFKGSDRQIRGAIIRTLSKRSCARAALHKALAQFDRLRIDAQLEKLQNEGMISSKKGRYALPG